MLATFDDDDGLGELLADPPVDTVGVTPSGGRFSFESGLSTPSVASQGGTGSTDGGHGLWVASEENIGKACMAEVGKDKKKFCTQDKDACGHKTHQENPNKASVKEGDIYVHDSKKNHAHLAPSINPGQLLK